MQGQLQGDYMLRVEQSKLRVERRLEGEDQGAFVKLIDWDMKQQAVDLSVADRWAHQEQVFLSG